MSDSRTKNAARNIVFGALNKFVSLVLPFVTRTLILYLLGASFLGIGTLFTSILSFLSLTELGLGSAIVYSMYKPIAEKDTDKICALLNFYKKMYRLIGIVVLLIGLAIVPFVPHLMKGDAPVGINVYVLYCIYLLNSVLSYFFFGYKQSLLTAHQRSDITSNIHTVINLSMQFSQILLLYLTRNFYVYAIVPIAGTMLTNISIAIVTAKKYPQYCDRGDVDVSIKKEIGKKISGLFGTKLNSIVVHSADVMVISSFLGLSLTAKYGNYYYIMNAVCGFVAIFYASLTAGIGNKIVTDSIDENYKLFKSLSFVNAWIIGWASVAFLCLYEPFMKLWVGEEMQLGIWFVVLLVAYFFVYEIQRTMFTFKDAVGLWHKDKLRPYVSMIVNVVSNLVLVQFIGIYGIVISTVIAFLISLPWVNNILFKNLFTTVKQSENLLRILWYFFVTVIACVSTYAVCSLFGDSFLDLFARIGVCVVLPNLIFLAFYHRQKEFVYFVKRIKRIVRK